MLLKYLPFLFTDDEIGIESKPASIYYDIEVASDRLKSKHAEVPVFTTGRKTCKS